MHLADNVDLQHGIAGGLIIGVSSTAFYYLTGKTTGISGIVEGVLVAQPTDDKSWTLTYFLGLVSAGVLLENWIPGSFGANPHALTLTPQAIALAGVLTGFGTRLGSGCTSGHGICGLPRRSARSLAAVCTFMATGALSSYLSRNTGLSQYVVVNATNGDTVSTPKDFLLFLAPTASALGIVATFFNRNFVVNRWLFGNADSEKSNEKSGLLEKAENRKATNDDNSVSTKTLLSQHMIAYGCAFAMGTGLVISGMCNPARVINFLNFTGPSGWDPSLMGVMGGGVALNLLTFQMMHSNNHAIPFASNMGTRIQQMMNLDFHPSNLVVDWKLLMGSAIFGLGWGLGGICPGPGLVSLGCGIKMAGMFVPYMIGGMAIQEVMFGKGFPFMR